MKVQDLKERQASFNAAYQAAVTALGSLSELYPLGAKDPDIVEAYSACRGRLMEGLFWHRYLCQVLATKSDEGQEALKKYIESMKAEEAKRTAEERKVRAAEEKAAGCVPQEVPEDSKPNLRFVTPEAGNGV